MSAMNVVQYCFLQNFTGDLHLLQEKSFIPNFCFRCVSICNPKVFVGLWALEDSKENKFLVHKHKFPL